MDYSALWAELFNDPGTLGYRDGFVDRGRNQYEEYIRDKNPQSPTFGEWIANPEFVPADDPSLQKDLLLYGCIRELLNLLNDETQAAVAQNVTVDGREVAELLLDNQAEWDALGVAVKENIKLLVNASGGVRFHATNRTRFETVLSGSPGLLAGVQALYTKPRSRAQAEFGQAVSEQDLIKAYEYAEQLDTGDPLYLKRIGEGE